MKMKNSWENSIEKIKDGFIIQRIRFLNLVKEHKYLSVGIGVFLFTCLVVLVAFASDDPYSGMINISRKEVNVQVQKNAENVYVVDSFSTVVYDVNYSLEFSDDVSNPESGITRSVEITATIDDSIDATWINSEDYASIENNGKKIILTIGNVGIDSSAVKGLYLSVKNVKNGTEIKPEITIKETTSSESKVDVPKVIVNSTTVNLTPKIIAGEQYKMSGFTGRYAPFGIMLGIEGYGSLKGLYFEKDAIVNLSASQLDNSIDLLTDENYYGIYKSNNMNFYNSKMIELSEGSGKIKRLDKTSNNTEEETEEVVTYEEVESPINIYFYGPMEMTYGVGDEYYEYGLLNENNEHICRTSSMQCTIYVDDEAESISKITDKVGTYNVYYKYYTEGDHTSNTSVTFKRTIKVVEKEDSIIGNKYFYSDLSDIWEDDLRKKYETGEIVNEETYTDFKETKPSDLTKFPRTYKYEYYNEEHEVVATTYLIINNNGINPENLKISKDGKLNRSGDNLKGPIYKNKDFEEIADVSSLKNYYVEYTYIDSNGFELKIRSEVNKEEKTTTISNESYSLEINNISFSSSEETIEIDGNSFIPIGSYYVTVKSPRPENNKDDIEVSLTASVGEKTNFNSSINYFKAYGSLTGDMDIYSIDSESDEENKLNFETVKEESNGKTQIASEHLAYGENLKLKSNIYYSLGADQNLGKITLAYFLSSTDQSGDISPFSVNISSEDDFKIKNSKTGEYIESSYKIFGCVPNVDSSGNSFCAELPEYKSYNEFLEATKSNDDLRLVSVQYEINNLAPNTMIELEQGLKVTGNNNNSGVIQSFISTEKESNYIIKQMNITPFKSKTRLFIDDNEQDIIVDGTEKTSSTLAIHPYISLPAQITNTYAAGVKNVDTNITLTLPENVSYVSNNNYINPTSIDGNTLTYVLEDVNVNEWLDVIYVDVNYDVTIPRNTDLLFKVTIDSSDDVTGLKDLSSIESRTTTRIVNYQNSDIAHGQYVSTSTISKENPFEVTTKIYNNSEDSINGLEVITILPYNDVNNSEYNGYYEISSLGDNAMCTVDESVLVEKDLGSTNSDIWTSCSDYKEDDYYGVTAVKYVINNDKEFSYNIEYKPIGNNVDDKYVVKSYLINDAKIISSKVSTVSVMSKKITGVVWEDFDSNGIMDLDENKISGVILRLFDADTDEQIDENVSDENGFYKLVVPKPGNYYVVADYNTDKYSISPVRTDIDDKSIISSFTADNSLEIATVEVDESDDNIEEEPNCDLREDEDGNEYIECCYEDGNCEILTPDDNPDYDFDDPDNDFEDDSIEDDEAQENHPTIKTGIIEFTDTTKVINNVNLGLSIKKNYKVKISKYITKVITTNNLGISNTKDYGNTTLAKLDVKDIGNLNIKVIYTFELQNTGYYPGYVYQIKDFIPEGMSFNKDYEENKGWELNEELGYIKNNTLSDELIYEGEKKYLTLALDITRKEAGSFVNYAMIDDDDLQILTMYGEEGSENDE